MLLMPPLKNNASYQIHLYNYDCSLQQFERVENVKKFIRNTLRCAVCTLAFVTFVDLCTFTTHIVAIVWKSRICVRNHQKNKGGLFLIQAYVGKSPP